MGSDSDNYTPPPIPDGYVETVNEEGDTVWRLTHLEARRRSRQHWQREEFLLLKLSGLVSALEMRPRIGIPALIVLLFTIQRDRTGRRELKINRDFALKVGYSRHSLYRGADWLVAQMGHLVTVRRSTGCATRVGLTAAGKRFFHPVATADKGGQG